MLIVTLLMAHYGRFGTLLRLALRGRVRLVIPTRFHCHRVVGGRQNGCLLSLSKDLERCDVGN
jgi:hypothetical protein